MYKIFIEKNTSTKALLDKVLKRLNISDEIIYNEYGKPYLKSNKIYFSLSDSKEYTVCAISDKEIGVDIEKITYKKRVINKVCNSEEIKEINTPEDFTKIWVKKESYSKLIGLGLSFDFKKIDTNRNKFDILKKGDYYISVSCEK